MKNERLVLNFLVFADQVAKGKLQAELLQETADLGFSQVEIRREYFKTIEEELPLIKSEAERLQLQLFYSVPDEVYVAGELNPKLGEYVKEAKQMGVKHIKWNIGEFTGDLHKDQLKELLSHGVEISIENDQTQTSGTISAITTYLEATKEAGVDIGYVYDLGNWRFVGEDEVAAAQLLKEFVRYIHVKDVCYEAEKPQAIGLDQGDIDWRKVLQILPQDVPVAIEYPTKNNAEILVAKKLLEEF